MPKVVILQRVVPSYRMKLFQRIWDELGWPIAFGKNLSTEGMCLNSDEPFLHGFQFTKSNFGMINVPLDEILTKLKPDAVIAEGALRLSSTWQLLARRRLFNGPKVYFWSTGYNTVKGLDGRGQIPSQWMYPAAFRHADGCLTYGNDGFSFLQPRVGRKPVFIAHNSIDMEEIERFRDGVKPLPRRGFPELVSVSRLTKAKEFEKLVHAHLLLLKTFPTAKLTIIGEGTARPSIELAAGEELGRSVFLTGAIYDESVIAGYMNRADAFVMTGRVGLAINHALGYGLPAICFRRTSSGPFHGSEITHLKDGTTGFFVEDCDVLKFADKLKMLFQSDPHLKGNMQQSIHRYVKSHLSIDRMMQGFVNIQNHLMTISKSS
jgi:glycosyltransferase involved in cell wall biosynthesis